MSKKSRYLLILGCFIFFLITAPLILLYVRGITYDFKSKKFISTGVLSIKTKPSDVQIFLDGVLVRKKSGNVKFLKPKDYKITLFVPGFWPWNKTLPVYPSEVTWAHNLKNKIFLLFQEPQKTSHTQNVLDFKLFKNKLISTNDLGELNILDSENLKKERTISIPSKAISILNIFKQEYAIVLTEDNEKWLINLKDDSAFQIPKMFPDGQFYFSYQGHLYIFHEQTLYRINFLEKSFTPVLKDLLAIEFGAEEFFYIQKTEKGNFLMSNLMPESASPTLLGNMPEFNKYIILINQEKQMFLLCDDKLFKYQGDLKLLNSNVKSAYFDYKNKKLIVNAGGEIGFYSENIDKFNFITRSTIEIKNIRINDEINYAFYLKNNSIKATELDNRDIQNDYLLFQTDQESKFEINESGDMIWLHEKNNLSGFKIR